MKQVVLYEMERVNKIMETKRKECLSINKQLENNPSDPLLKESLAELKQELKEFRAIQNELWHMYKKINPNWKKTSF
ncbi:hypothetical protein ABER75_09235 [Niallia taxi]|uniref:hypothetical protein n=1 Tax=Niallia taxi TaxID=2499688 RepID=UPI003D2D74F1